MDMTPYRIIWADDEVDIFVTPKDEKNWKEDFGIEIVGKAHTGSELRDIMKSNIYLLDAVIVDANFDEYESSPQEEGVISGLRCAFDLNRIYNEEGKKGIPFFLYTGRNREFLVKSCEPADQKKLKNLFEDKERWFEKLRGDMLAIMFEKIKKDVDEERSEEGILRRRFAKEFKAAELIEDGQKWLMQALLFDQNILRIENIEDKFNPARDIIEGVFDKCKEFGILPPLSSLNSMPQFLQNYVCDGYVLKTRKQLMHPVLASSFDLFLDVAQDGSHKREDLLLHIKRYVKETHNTNLYRALVYLIMDVLLWFKNNVDNPPEEALWSEAEGIVKEYRNGNNTKLYVNCSDKLIEVYNKDKPVNAGDKVRIIKTVPHKRSFSTPEGLVMQFSPDFKKI